MFIYYIFAIFFFAYFLCFLRSTCVSTVYTKMKQEQYITCVFISLVVLSLLCFFFCLRFYFFTGQQTHRKSHIYICLALRIIVESIHWKLYFFSALCTYRKWHWNGCFFSIIYCIGCVVGYKNMRSVHISNCWHASQGSFLQPIWQRSIANSTSALN